MCVCVVVVLAFLSLRSWLRDVVMMAVQFLSSSFFRSTITNVFLADAAFWPRSHSFILCIIIFCV